MSSDHKIIAIIGVTGGQGIPAVKHLLKPTEDGKPSPYKVRGLTRDKNHRRAEELQELGVELVEGTFQDSDAIFKLFEGAYGAFVNTDGFTVGAAVELTAAFNIYEIAQAQGLKHFVWSSLDYSLKLGKYNPIYGVDHYNGKGRFAAYLLGSESIDPSSGKGLGYTVFTNGPYMDMIEWLFAPFKKREDGTLVWALPIGDKGTIPLIALDDIGWWARYIFDHPSETHSKDLRVASDPHTGPQIIATYEKATGGKGEYIQLSMDEYFALWENGNEQPVAANVKDGKTWEQNFRAFFSQWRDNIVKRDMEWVRKVNPDTWTLERWMKEHNFTGERNLELLKINEDEAHAVRPAQDKVDAL